ncbi:GntR family transcriptional regulator [Vibrio sp. Isolate31]|uniref:GntR family transcriptional regulator n=1 Tax=unclassified Vibrio TaxID=2614977 RepID=UPI001EFE7BAB|nr:MULTISPECIES: GntR family transcriptional regulator [unclassified Vibrio]MCG9554330.1 GntR family transcriptional regulator [Vibrio sp. Isolate32]MCG9603169.1 GntR family transcriptional regulator [Vibrio sp. Isolate31]
MTNANGLTQYQPLYSQVKQLFIQRLIDKSWKPGMHLPSEQQLAKELNVSQGTVRKALDEMSTEKLVIRKQGRGTFIAEHTDEKTLFHFFKLVDQNGNRQAPNSEVISSTKRVATKLEAEKLNLTKNEKVIEILRGRLLEGHPAILEYIVLPSSIFTREIEKDTLPNNLYSYYQREFFQSVTKANENLSAIAAQEATAKYLNIQTGSPILKIERLAMALDNTPIELRISYCLTENYSYFNELN